MTTSQNVTAPKLGEQKEDEPPGLTTSQNVTAPKLKQVMTRGLECLTTSQNATAPKLKQVMTRGLECLTTSQNVTAPKHMIEPNGFCACLTTSQNVTAPKPVSQCENAVITIHNHSHNFDPSFGDLVTLSKNSKMQGSIILCHDGSVWYIATDNTEIADMLEELYNTLKDELGEMAEIAALEQVKDRARKVGLTWEKLR